MNNTLVKGLQVLEALTRSHRPLGVSELADILELGRSNVHRLLQALVELKYVLKVGSSSEYTASLKVWELGNRLSPRLAVRYSAEGQMAHLLQTTRESVHLSVLDGHEVMYVHKLESPEPVRAYTDIGGKAPAHCVATGKALLAWQSEAFIASFLANGLVQHSKNTIVDSGIFLRELERIRTLGYAVNRGEWRDTVWGIAAPIRDSAGTVVAALGISGPSSRIKPAQIKTLGTLVSQAAKAVSLDAPS